MPEILTTGSGVLLDHAADELTDAVSENDLAHLLLEASDPPRVVLDIQYETDAIGILRASLDGGRNFHPATVTSTPGILVGVLALLGLMIEELTETLIDRAQDAETDLDGIGEL